MSRGDILAVVGGQFGSEGKGNLVAHVAMDYDIHVRVGGPNAGHSFKHKYSFQGPPHVFKMQSIPCGWINKNAYLVLGRGMLISPEQLYEEWKLLTSFGADLDDRFWIDKKAGILSPWHHNEAGGVHGEAHKRYGSTGEGVGVARLARISRRPGEGCSGFYHAGTLPDSLLPEDDGFRSFWHRALVDDTPKLIEDTNAKGARILLEGTQGAGLSLIHGPWPYTTNHDTNAAQLAADVGIPPRFVNRCLLVVRTLPIRVAGNSGPMQQEIDWDEVSRRVGKPVTEQTTVTKKTRRVAEWDEDLVLQAVTLNAPTSVAVNFIDYLSPADEGVYDENHLSDKAWTFIEYVGRITGTPVLLAGTGGENWEVCRLSPPRNGDWRL